MESVRSGLSGDRQPGQPRRPAEGCQLQQAGYLALQTALDAGCQVVLPVAAQVARGLEAGDVILFDFVLAQDGNDSPLRLQVPESDAVWDLLAERRWPIRKIC